MISVIIPAYNEAIALPTTLTCVFSQGAEHEVIVVDGGSDDDTRALATADARVRLITAPKGRASQMNAGARQARGEWLLFLHADTLLPDGALETITGLPDDVQAGGFHHRFSGNDWRLQLISWMHNLRCRWTHVFYGDQAFFVRRALFQRLGGFSTTSVIEDVAFGEKLRACTRPVLLAAHITTDARKFTRMGVWRSLGRVALILTCHELRLPIPARAFFRDVR